MSVIIKRCMGRYGNQLFPYFLGRIISEHLKFKLFGPYKNDGEFCLHDIEITYNQPGFNFYDKPVVQYGVQGNSETEHPDFNLDDILNDKSPRQIVLDGYLQRKKWFLPYKDTIVKWFNPIKYDVSKDDVAVHVRLGDLLLPNMRSVLTPLEYYIESIENIKFSKVTICTDSPDDREFIEPLCKRFNATLFKGNEKESISFLSSHNNLILSQGTFSFWAAFLSNGENIINLIPKTGFNSLEMRNKIDLMLEGPNYKYIKQK
jgi:hypothetical protein